MTIPTTGSLRRTPAVATVVVALLCVSRVVGAQPAFEVLHAFAGGADAGNPVSLIQARDGMFYGTTLTGGAGTKGTVFRMTADGQVTILHAFSGPDGAAPAAALLQATDGDFYGTTRDGGEFGLGTTFKMTADGQVTLFTRSAAADRPRQKPLTARTRLPALIQATDGLFYGMTKNGGRIGCGTSVAVRKVWDSVQHDDRLASSLSCTGSKVGRVFPWEQRTISPRRSRPVEPGQPLWHGK